MEFMVSSYKLTYHNQWTLLNIISLRQKYVNLSPEPQAVKMVASFANPDGLGTEPIQRLKTVVNPGIPMDFVDDFFMLDYGWTMHFRIYLATGDLVDPLELIMEDYVVIPPKP